MSSFRWIANSLKNLRIQGTTVGGQNVQARSPQQKTTQSKFPEKPMKRPLSPYLRYAMAVRPDVVSKNPGMKPTEVMKLCSQRWTELDQAQKENFSAQFKKELEEYNKVMEKFTRSLTPEQKNAMEQARADKVMKRDKLQKKQRLEELGKPKRPKSSYMNFLASQADILKKTGSPEEIRERIKSLSAKWNSLSEEEKAPFFETYRKDMEAYAKALAKWEEKMIRMGNDDLVRLNKKVVKA